MKVFVTVGVTIGSLGIMLGADPRRDLPVLPPGRGRRHPVPDRPEFVGPVGALPDRTAVQDRPVRGRRDRPRSRSCCRSSRRSTRRGRRRAPTRSRCFAMSEPVLQTTRPEAQLHPGRRHHRGAARGRPRRSQPGEIVALLGPSGSGKSTLLQAVGLLEGGFEGSIRIAGEEAAELDDDGRTAAAPRRCSASSISSTICCPISTRARMSCCRS